MFQDFDANIHRFDVRLFWREFVDREGNKVFDRQWIPEVGVAGERKQGHRVELRNFGSKGNGKRTLPGTVGWGFGVGADFMPLELGKNANLGIRHQRRAKECSRTSPLMERAMNDDVRQL